MDYNALKKKYTSAAETRRGEEPVAEVHRTSVQTRERTEPVTVQREESSRASTTQERRSVQAAERKQVVVNLDSTTMQHTTRGTQGSEDVGGFFGGESTSVRRTTTRSRQPWPGWRNLRDGLTTLPWVDIIMILLTIVGIIWVIVNFDAVTLRIAAVVGLILDSVIGIFLIVAAIVGLVLILFWRRPRFYF